jgi:peptide/nickel transport system substrate-binding protein
MKRVVAMLVAVLLVGAVVVPPVAAQAPPGVLQVAIIGDVTLNPFTLPQQLPTLLVAKVVFSTLTRYQPGDLKPVGDLAESWRAMEDGRVWEFKLRKGVRWHDGKPFTAADVKFTLEAIVNPETKALFSTQLKGLQRVDAVDDATARVVFKDPFPTLPIVLAFNIPMAPKHLLEGKELSTLTEFVRQPVGTGPFKLKEAAKGSHVIVEANAAYHGGGAPRLKAIAFKVVPDVNSVVAQLRTGELDVAVVTATHKETLSGAGNLSFKTIVLPSTFFLALNNARWPFDDRRVRQALMHGLNRELMVQRLLKGEAPVAAGPYATAFGPYVNGDLKPYPFSVARAKELLAEAGFKPGADGVLVKDGKRLAFELMVDKGNPEREQIALYTQQSWKQLGADVKLDVEEWSVFIRKGNRVPSGEYDARTGWRITSPDPDKSAEYATGGINNHFAYSNPEVDALMAKARATVDEGARVAAYRKVQELIHRDVPLLWVYHQTEILAISKRVRGYPELGIRDALPWAHQLAVQ